MLLEKLDVPQVMPQTMAFVVDRARLAHFRQALRGVLEEGDFELGPRLSMSGAARAPTQGPRGAWAWAGSRTAVDLIGTPFCDSVGPGPFLAPPTCASSLQNPEWEVLPLFEVTHRKWPLVDGHMLGGKALLQAEEEVRASKPSRQWHTNFARVDDARWEELLTEHWARCRSRFANALARAYRAHEAVLMLPNDRSKPFWAGIDWPAPPPPATWSTTPHCPRLNEAPCDLACVE